MIKTYTLQGDIEQRGTYSLSQDRTLKDILLNEAGGMKKHQRIKMIQVGGPLGISLSGEEINYSLEQIEGAHLNSSIYFFNDLLCPVDYLRFLTRYMIREVKLDTDRMRKLNKHIESIAQGESTMTDLAAIKDMTKGDGDTFADDLFNLVCRTLIAKFEPEFLEHIKDKKCENGICRGLIVSQCINACPANINIPGYVELMKSGRHLDAYSLMRQENPLSFICGKVCARPCEDRCRRGEIESKVGVRALHRFAASTVLDSENFKEDKSPDKGKSIGIVGAGPGGLSSAYYLARTGYNVTIYEAENHVGGMLAFGVPAYRLPYEDILKEVRTIEALGVTIKTNTRIGTDVSFETLKSSHDALLITSGCHVGNMLPKFDDPHIEAAATFLHQVRLEDRKSIGNRVLVVGGGDVAMDASRTAIRLGSQEVCLVSLEKHHEMPASLEERTQAVEEGVCLLNGWGIKDIAFGDEIKVKLQECTQVLDDNYQFKPEFNSLNVKEISVDSVILAIGQKPNLDYLPEEYQTSRGFLSVNSSTFETNIAGVFAAGDVTKPSIAIQAIASAKKAAIRIDQFLGGHGIYVGKPIEIPETPLKITTWDDALSKEKQLDSKLRVQSFDEVSGTYTPEDAKLEASRCMRCDRNSNKPLLLVPQRV